MYQCLLLGSQWCWFNRYLTVSKWPLAQARESGVSPALLTVPVHVWVYTEWCSNWCTIIMYQCLLLGSQWCWFTRYLTVSKWPSAQARESGVSPVLLTGSVEDHHQQRNSTDNTYYLDQHACWWGPWPSPGYHGNTQGREECLQPYSLQLWIQANYVSLQYTHSLELWYSMLLSNIIIHWHNQFSWPKKCAMIYRIWW